MLRFLLLILLLPMALTGQNLHISNPIRFLALGDSYTIGQSVSTQSRWPVQLADSLEKRGFEIDTLGIIATTGWRTDNLIIAVKNKNLEEKDFNLVSVLIGVNNQYQGRPVSQYITELGAILDSAILYAGGDPAHVFVVSIPDYAFTPFGQQSSDPQQISTEIDQYNTIAREMAASLNLTYFDITGISSQGLAIPSYVANDGLHPSEIQYTEWVKLILAFIDNKLSSNLHDKEFSPGEITITPNPASSNIKIDIPAYISSRITSLQLFDITGSKLMDCTFHEKTINLSIATFPDGLYFIKINTENYQTISKVLKKSY